MCKSFPIRQVGNELSMAEKVKFATKNLCTLAFQATGVPLDADTTRWIASIQDVAEWLGHSPKVMLKHYRRVREDVYKRVVQYKLAPNHPLNVQNNFDGAKPPELCKNPTKTSVNDDKKLTVYLTVHSPAEGEIRG